MVQGLNLTNVTQGDDLLKMAQIVNSGSDGVLFPSLLFVIFMITFISSSFRIKASNGLAFAGFITFIISMFMTVMDLLNQKYMYLSLIVLAGGVVWSIFDND